MPRTIVSGCLRCLQYCRWNESTIMTGLSRRLIISQNRHKCISIGRQQINTMTRFVSTPNELIRLILIWVLLRPQKVVTHISETLSLCHAQEYIPIVEQTPTQAPNAGPTKWTSHQACLRRNQSQILEQRWGMFTSWETLSPDEKRGPLLSLSSQRGRWELVLHYFNCATKWKRKITYAMSYIIPEKIRPRRNKLCALREIRRVSMSGYNTRTGRNAWHAWAYTRGQH